MPKSPQTPARNGLAKGSRTPRIFGGNEILYFRWRDSASKDGDFIRTDITGAPENVVAAALFPEVAVPGVEPDAAPRVNPFLRCARNAARCLWAPWGGSGIDLLPLNVRTGNQVIVPRLEVEAFHARSVALSWDGSLAAAGRARNVDPWIRFFALTGANWGDQHGREERPDSLFGKVSLPTGCSASYLAFAPDGSGVFSAGVCDADPPHRLFFVGRDNDVRQIDSRRTGRYVGVAASPDGKKLAVTIAQSELELWLVDAVKGAWPEPSHQPVVTDHAKWRDRRIRCLRSDGSETCGSCCETAGDRITPYPDCRCTFDGERWDRDQGNPP